MPLIEHEYNYTIISETHDEVSTPSVHLCVNIAAVTRPVVPCWPGATGLLVSALLRFISPQYHVNNGNSIFVS